VASDLKITCVQSVFAMSTSAFIATKKSALDVQALRTAPDYLCRRW
jgi:hypothetical protein